MPTPIDIQQATDTLAGAVITKQKEIDALNLATSVLQNTFTAEFTSRDQALKELSAIHANLAVKVIEVQTERAEKLVLSEQVNIAQAETLAVRETFTTEQLAHIADNTTKEEEKRVLSEQIVAKDIEINIMSGTQFDLETEVTTLRAEKVTLEARVVELETALVEEPVI